MMHRGLCVPHYQQICKALSHCDSGHKINAQNKRTNQKSVHNPLCATPSSMEGVHTALCATPSSMEGVHNALCATASMEGVAQQQDLQSAQPL